MGQFKKVIHLFGEFEFFFK